MVMGEVTADTPPPRAGLLSADPARPVPPRPHELRGKLRPAELAEAAVLGDLGLVLEVLGWFVPLVGAVFQGLAIVPFAALGSRHRARTCVVAIFAASSVSFLVGGVGIVIQTAIAGSLGLAVGTAYRRKWSPSAAVLIATVTAGIPVAVISLVAEALSPGLRRLAFAQVEILWRNVRAVLNLLGFHSLASSGDKTLQWAIDHWWVTVPAFELFAVMLAAGLCRGISGHSWFVWSATHRRLLMHHAGLPEARSPAAATRLRSPSSSNGSPTSTPAASAGPWRRSR